MTTNDLWVRQVAGRGRILRHARVGARFRLILTAPRPCRRTPRRGAAFPEMRVWGRCRSTRRLSRTSRDWRAFRSEEHTSELQSLMRIPYDVFRLTKTKTQPYQHHAQM